MRIRFLEGDSARSAIADPGFRGDWEALAADDPKVTWFQEPCFVEPWYRAYRESWTPLLAVAESSGGELVGIMPLALAGGAVTHAGDHQCNYQGWVAAAGAEGDFPARVVAEVFRREAPHRWTWKHLPPGAPVNWADELGRSAPAGVHTERLQDPVLDVSDREFLEAKRRSERNRMNRLERRGVHYERIVDPDGAVRALRAMAPWCDLRQGAVHGDLPFLQDPAKLPFHEALAREPERIWMSVLRSDDEIVAGHIAFYGGTELFAGVQAYDPAFGRCSPGIVLLLEMAEDLIRCGGRTLDLTPGGDRWKERFCTRHREVWRIEFVRSRLGALTDRAARTVEDGARRAIRSVGVEPSRLKKVARPAEWIGDGGSGPGASGLHRVPVPTALAEEGPVESGRRRVAELLLARVVATGEPDEALLEDVLRRLHDEWKPLAVVDRGELRLLAWIPPVEIAAVHLDAEGAPRLQRQGAPEPEGCTVVPASELLVDLVLESPSATPEDTGRLLRGVAARRPAGIDRLLVRTGTATPRADSWLARQERTGDRAVGS